MTSTWPLASGTLVAGCRRGIEQEVAVQQEVGGKHGLWLAPRWQVDFDLGMTPGKWDLGSRKQAGRGAGGRSASRGVYYFVERSFL